MIVEDLKKSILDYLLYGKAIIKNMSQLKNDPNTIISDIPADWKLVKIGSVIEIARGGSPRPIKSFLTNSEDGINWIKIGDTKKGSKFIESCKERIIKEGMKKSRYVQKGDFLLSNSMSFGRPYILNIDGCIHDGWLVLKDNNNTFLKDYLFYVLSSDFVYKQFCDKASGAVVNNLNTDKVKDTVIPLPPIEEQQEIVNKIEKLFKKLDEIEPIEKEIINLKTNFSNNFRKSIIQSACNGSLSLQNESESVLDIVDYIREKNSKLKIITDDVPFQIPNNWIWIRFGDLVNFNIGKTPARADSSYWGNDYKWVSISDMVDDGYVDDTKEGVSNKSYNDIFKGNICKKGTLIMSFKLTVGRCSILNIDAFHNEGIISIYPYYESDILKKYLMKILPFMTKYGDTKGAIKGNTLNSTSLKKLLVPLPPIEEQKRIVDKIEELLPLLKDVDNIVNS